MLKIFFPLFLLCLSSGIFAQAPLEVWQLQGSSGLSPFQFQTVYTEDNVVTAIGSGLFFIQTPTERSDNNPLTSDGIVVYSSAAATVQPGSRVSIVGTVSETSGMTGIVATEVQVLSPSGPLPTPVRLSASLPLTTASSLHSLERVEGMRVDFVNAKVCSPSNDSEHAALVTTDELPRREPGVRFPGQAGLLVWDGNPEIFWINPDALNAPNNRFLSVGMQVSGAGIMVQSGSRYFFWPNQYTTSGAPAIIPARPAELGEITLASFNALQLRTDNPNYGQHVQKVARYVVDALRLPHIIALQEVGNLVALQDLAYYIGQLSGGTQYTPYFLAGNDDINTAYLLRPGIQNIMLSQLGKNEFLSLGGRLHDRPPLLLEVDLPTDPPVSLAVMNLHLRSLIGIEGNDAAYVRIKRHEQAVSVASKVQARQHQNLFVVGDFNAFGFSDGYVDIHSQITGRPTLGALIMPQPIVQPPLVDYASQLPPEEQFSYIFDGSAQQLDHCLSTQLQGLEVVDFQFVRGNAGASVAYEPNLQLFAASSDHDGFVIYLRPSSPVNVIDQEEDPLALAIYPNPCKAGDCQLTVNAAVQIDALEVKDIMGRTRFVIQPEFLSASSLMLIELPLPAGLYTIKMKSREKIYIRSLIIQ
jgi:endonuclease/exonuclease/phosphatase family metal-dependent hydrolase